MHVKDALLFLACQRGMPFKFQVVSTIDGIRCTLYLEIDYNLSKFIWHKPKGQTLTADIISELQHAVIPLIDDLIAKLGN